MNIYGHNTYSTLLIECGTNRGSGFHFIRPEIIVTNYHVIEEYFDSGELTLASTDDGYDFELELIGSSPTDQNDFVIFRTPSDIPDGREALKPKVVEKFEIGREIAFSGFPHGIEDLIVQRAIVSGHVDEEIFYIDGSVNGGNSGGPIVDLIDGSIIGIVTERRFLGGVDLDNLQQVATQIQEHWRRMREQGSVQIMGMDFGALSSLMADAMVLIKDVLEANANTGIGIGYSVRFVAEECENLGIM